MILPSKARDRLVSSEGQQHHLTTDLGASLLDRSTFGIDLHKTGLYPHLEILQSDWPSPTFFSRYFRKRSESNLAMWEKIRDCDLSAKKYFSVKRASARTTPSGLGSSPYLVTNHSHA